MYTIDQKNIKKALTAVLASKERKFVESIDIHIGLKDVNLKDPSKRFRMEVLLPNAPNKTIKIAVVGDAATLNDAKEAGVKMLYTEEQVEALAKNPKEARLFTKEIDYVLAIPQLMAVVGKNLGRYLGPVGKTPSVIPPNTDMADLLNRYSRTCKIRLRQNPAIHARVGTRDMSEEQLVENISTVLNELESRLDQGKKNFKTIYIKTTMGAPIAIGGLTA